MILDSLAISSSMVFQPSLLISGWPGVSKLLPVTIRAARFCNQITKYLGLQIDNSLDWKEHVKTVSSKVSRAIGFLKHAKSSLPEETLRTMYTGIVEPHFRYCCSVWGCCGATEINQLQKFT